MGLVCSITVQMTVGAIGDGWIRLLVLPVGTMQTDADLRRTKGLPDFAHCGLQNVADFGLRREFGADGVDDAFALGSTLTFLKEAGVIQTDGQTIGQFLRELEFVIAEITFRNFPLDRA